jgi:hypothetical protein
LSSGRSFEEEAFCAVSGVFDGDFVVSGVPSR